MFLDSSSFGVVSGVGGSVGGVSSVDGSGWVGCASLVLSMGMSLKLIGALLPGVDAIGGMVDDGGMV